MLAMGVGGGRAVGHMQGVYHPHPPLTMIVWHGSCNILNKPIVKKNEKNEKKMKKIVDK